MIARRRRREGAGHRAREVGEGRWYGDYRVAAGDAVELRVGPLGLWLARLPGEWRIATKAGGNSLDESLALGGPEKIGQPPEGSDVRRFVTRAAGDEILLVPRLADRPVVSRPDLSLTVLAGDGIDLYVSTPLWIALELPGGDGRDPRTLIEVPTARPSDTWFGPDTRHGSACYGVRTAARQALPSLPRPPHRAVTKVSLRNQSSNGLLLERFRLPLPNLSLWADEKGHLWTPTVDAEATGDVSGARVELGETAPPEAEGATLVSPPREPPSTNVLHRAMQVLLG